MGWISNFIEELKCKHEWEFNYETEVYNEFGYCYTKYTYACKKCKAHKTKR